MLTTDVLIVGSGPAGATAALVLSRLGVEPLLITKHSWLANAPRAHVISQRTMEIMRDLGVEKDVWANAIPRDVMREAVTVFCMGVAGEEIARIRAFGGHPIRRGEYEHASPTLPCDIPQHLLEPILFSRACALGAHARLSTEYLSLVEDETGVTATLRDRLTGESYPVRAKYVIGANGANSGIPAEIGLPREGRPVPAVRTISVWARVDLSRWVAHRPGSIYLVLRPDPPKPRRGGVRMVRPYDEWMFAAALGEDDDPEVDEARARAIVHGLVGDDTVPVEILNIETWTRGGDYPCASRFASRRVFCMGDAVHRLPPANGLGANSAIQEAYNLAWKLAFVVQGKAGPALLETYDEERAPIGRQFFERAIKSELGYRPLIEATGWDPRGAPEEVRAMMESLKDATDEAAARRAALRRAVAGKEYEYNAHGVESNQRYRASRAIAYDGTPEPPFDRDPELCYQPTTWPGAPLPHVWLGRGAHGERISTLDVVGKGRFVLLAGSAGEAWRDAAAAARTAFGIELGVYAIGPRGDFTDLYGDWADVCGIGDAGCLLVRPDAYVAFRAVDAVDARERLRRALSTVLGR